MPATQPLPLFAPEPDEGDALAGLLAEAQATADDPAAAPRDAGLDVLAHVAEKGDGVYLLADLLAAGHARAVVAALLTQGTDKRVRPRLALGNIGGHAVIWLRSSGWQAVGQPNRREAAPTQRSLRHRLAPYNLDQALRASVEPVAFQREILLDVVRGAPLRAYIEQCKGSAWSVIRGGASAADSDSASAVLGGVYPDALVSESWPWSLLPVREATWPESGQPTAHVPPMSTEWNVAIEIELSGKSAPLVEAKLRQHDTAMQLGWWQAVVWITDDLSTLTRLLRSGLGQSRVHPGHYFLPGGAVGIGGYPAVPIGAPVPATPWWAAPLAATPLP